MENKVIGMEKVGRENPVRRILIYPLVRARLFNAFVSFLKPPKNNSLQIDVLVSQKYGDINTLVADNSLVFKNSRELPAYLSRIKNNRYDAFIALVSWMNVSPKLLVKIFMMKALMFFARVRCRQVVSIDNSSGGAAKILRRLLRVLPMYAARPLKIIFLRLVYPVCELFFNLFSPSRIKIFSGKAKIKKVLVIENDLIGDVVWATPCLAALRKRMPQAKIHFLCGSWAKEIIKNSPDVDAVIEYDVPWFGDLPGNKTILQRGINRLDNIRKRVFLFFQHYDLAIDLRADPRTITLAYFTGAALRAAYKNRTSNNYAAFLLTTAVDFPWEKVHLLHIIEHNLNVLKNIGVEPVGKDPVIFTAGSCREKAGRFLAENGIDTKDILVGIHPGTSRKQKQWPAESFAQVADGIIDCFKAKIVITGSAQESVLAQEIASLMKNKPVIAAGKLGLEEFVELVRKMKLLVCGETLTISIASAVKTPLVCLMSGVPVLFGPYNLKAQVLQKSLECYDPVFEHCMCEHLPYRCLAQIKPEEVLCAVKKIYN